MAPDLAINVTTRSQPCYGCNRFGSLIGQRLCVIVGHTNAPVGQEGDRFGRDFLKRVPRPEFLRLIKSISSLFPHPFHLWPFIKIK
ncbi:MAG: hypothetical protein JWQ87_962 [Candidatus Sulfotelmatobacter sp.]|nr:hypothetical protein [Candidatus Sulfotelmatobacter sp.]